MIAARDGRTEIADLLVRSNADVNVKDNVRIDTIYIVYVYHRLLALYIYTYRYTNIRTLLYIQNTYEYIHISAYRHFHV